MPRISKGQNPNGPKKGDKIAVEPIRSKKDIGLVKKLLADKPRDFCLFTVGINTAFRASDLIRITAGQVRHLQPDDELVLTEHKTGKVRRVNLNRGCIDAIQALLKSRPYQDDEILFTGQRGPLTVESINRLVKNWCRQINLPGNYGSHSLRKTFGFHKRANGFDIPTLMEVYGHSTQRQTQKYLCIQPSEIADVYKHQL